jgi:chemotaxis-related protein WspD
VNDLPPATARNQSAQPDSARQPEQAGARAECWNLTGVSGDATCADLAVVGHCHNCELYSSAGSHALERAIPPGYRVERTRYYADKRSPSAGSRLSIAVFRVGVEWLALPTQVFQEVVEPRLIHSVPHRGEGVLLGLVNIRGELALCGSLARLLGLAPASPGERVHSANHRLLVMRWEGKRVAFPADEVHGVCRVHPDEVTRPPETIARATLSFTQGVVPWQGRMVGLLDPEALFTAFNRTFA